MNIDIKEIKNWKEIARKEQIMPEGNNWWIWLILAGRGFGKTRTGAETLMELVNSGKFKRIGIIGKTISEVKDVMVEGVSGLLSTTIAKKALYNKENKIDDPSTINFRYYKSQNKIVWENGAVAYLLSGDNPEKLRGYQFDFIWMDEFAKYRKPEKLWNQVLFTLRVGDYPRCLITTTPKPIKLLKELSEYAETHLTRGSTFDNEANLSKLFIKRIMDRYKDTHIGKQELEGILVMEKENTVWKQHNILYKDIEMDNISRVVIGVDPAVTSGDNSDETGIIVAGKGYDDKIYILDDLSGKYAPSEWSKVIARAVHEYKASRVVAEINQGGDLVREMLCSIDPNIPFKATHAIKNKVARAEPIALLYESQKVYHKKEFVELEEQMCDISYDEDTQSSRSPDRVDALVWAVSALKSQEICRFTLI